MSELRTAFAIGHKFYRLRMGLGLSQDQLAEKLGVTVDDIGSWEKGNPPDGAVLAAAAALFEVTVEELTPD